MKKNVVFYLLFLSLTVIAITGGCSPKNDPADVKAVTEAINKQLLELTGEPVSDPTDFIGILNQKLSLEVKETLVKDNQDVALIEVSAPNVAGLLEDLYENNEDEETTYEELSNTLIEKTKTAPLIKKEIAVNFFVLDGEIEVEFTEELIDAMYGGLFTYTKQLFSKLEEDF